MTTQTEVLKLALEALKSQRFSKVIEATNAIEEALAQPEQEPDYNAISDSRLMKMPEQKPMAWIEHHKGGDNLNWEEVNHPYAKATPLYTPPPQLKPLTDEQIMDMYNEPRSDAEMLEFARAIEEAHGIKE